MKLTKRIFAMLALMPIFALCIACGEDPLNDDSQNGSNGDNSGGDQEQYEDIKVVDGKVRFYLMEKKNATRTAANMTARDWSKSSVVMNGETYDVEFTDEETPRPYVEVAKASSYNATLITSSSNKWYDESTTKGVMVPHSQIYHNAISNIKSLPLSNFWIMGRQNQVNSLQYARSVMICLKPCTLSSGAL